MKRLKVSIRKGKYIKLLILQILAIYYIFSFLLPISFLNTFGYFSDETNYSVSIQTADKFPKPLKDSSSLEEVKSWAQCPKVFGSFYNNGGDMLVDTTWSVYKQIDGNNWSLVVTYPLKALKSKENRILEYEPLETGKYRFVVEQVPTHKGNSHPEIETIFNYEQCQSIKKITNQNIVPITESSIPEFQEVDSGIDSEETGITIKSSDIMSSETTETTETGVDE